MIQKMLLKYSNSVKAFTKLLAIGVGLLLLYSYIIQTYFLVRCSTHCEDWFFDNQNVMQNNSDILKYLREHHLTPPSKDSYQLIHPKRNPSEFGEVLKNIFGNMRNGFFIESGANDGEYLSNTLDLERNQNWTGLLIEPNAFIFPQLKKKNRKAWIADVCLSLKTYPQKVKFLHHAGKSNMYKAWGITEDGGGFHPIDYIKDPAIARERKNYVNAGVVNCFPLFSLLSAINVTKVDYISLDMEGVELKVIQAIPFDSVDITVISAEVHLIPEGILALIEFMESKGFKKSVEVDHEIFFVKKT